MIHKQIMHYWITHKRDTHRIHELPSPVPIEGQPRRARAPVARGPTSEARALPHVLATSGSPAPRRAASPGACTMPGPHAPATSGLPAPRRAASSGAWPPRLGVEAPRAGDERFACAVPSHLTGRLATGPQRGGPTRRRPAACLRHAEPPHQAPAPHLATAPPLSHTAKHLRLDACSRRPERLGEREREIGVHAVVCGLRR
ncbi:hypothetical protein C2845_PM17G03940 [Panicum miliaceum]|uniref:Uncharacterized protein n=1 Tax=Panicum miliaceum TaxID=4540 RepID=A0A3L6Q423_PANMI|nr:hypothetical protein C2845_PM17G03940 [Panicum miliaceum]